MTPTPANFTKSGDSSDSDSRNRLNSRTYFTSTRAVGFAASKNLHPSASFSVCVTGSLSLSQGVVKELVGEMEEAGFECYETDIGGEGALFMENFLEKDIKGAVDKRTVKVSFAKQGDMCTLEVGR